MQSDHVLLSQLPPVDSEAGILARILLAETVGPADPRFNEAECLEAMQYMQLVVVNRMKDPKRFLAKGKSMRDIVRAPGQFKGFEAYPSIAAQQEATILDMLRYRLVQESALGVSQNKVAEIVKYRDKLYPPTAKRDPFQPTPKRYFSLEADRLHWEDKASGFKSEAQQGKTYVDAALEICGKAPIPDPTPGTLVFWRTSKASSPADGAVFHATKSGNDFYYIAETL